MVDSFFDVTNFMLKAPPIGSKVVPFRVTLEDPKYKPQKGTTLEPVGKKSPRKATTVETTRRVSEFSCFGLKVSGLCVVRL